MRSAPKKKQSKAVSTPIAILALVIVLVLAAIVGWKVLSLKEMTGAMSHEASIAAGSRYKFVVDRWNKEVELAKTQGRAPDERLKPRPTGAMAPGGRPLGMEGMGAGSLATRPGEASGQQSPGGAGMPPGSGR